LFCFLLLHRDRPHSREILASLLWRDHTDRNHGRSGGMAAAVVLGSGLSRFPHRIVTAITFRGLLWVAFSLLLLSPMTELQRGLHHTPTHCRVSGC
jgi:hypothetical protein